MSVSENNLRIKTTIELVNSTLNTYPELGTVMIFLGFVFYFFRCILTTSFML